MVVAGGGQGDGLVVMGDGELAGLGGDLANDVVLVRLELFEVFGG